MQVEMNKTRKRALRRRVRKHQRRDLNQKHSTADAKLKQRISPQFMDSHWWQTYETLVRWHSEHQMNYWRQRALRLQQENDFLRKIESLRYTEDCESSSDEDLDSIQQFLGEAPETDDLEIDEGYLKFLAVTRKHQAELKARRERDTKGDSS